jgi:spermidine/putrescine transport system permease protein
MRSEVAAALPAWRLRSYAGWYLTLLVPATIWLVVWVVIPISTLFVYSFYRVRGGAIVAEPSLDNYRSLFDSPVYFPVLFRTLRLGLLTALTCVLLAYPGAYYIARYASPRGRTLAYFLVVLPLLTSYVVRIYAWRLILGHEGLVNAGLESLGVIHQPLRLFLFSSSAVFIALVGALLPFAALPILNSLEKIPPVLFEASSDLGASEARTFWKVVFPLSLPGVAAGASFVFVIATGDFIASQFLGGASGILIGKVIYSTFGLAFNWPLGAAMSFGLFAISAAIVLASGRMSEAPSGS